MFILKFQIYYIIKKPDMQNLEISDLPSLAKWKRESLLNWLSQNDRNGIFTDEQSKAEGMQPMTKKEALEVIKRIVTENQ